MQSETILYLSIVIYRIVFKHFNTMYSSQGCDESETGICQLEEMMVRFEMH